MAMKPCRECNRNVSTEAKICPNCGIKRPAKKSSWGQSTLIALGITALFFMWLAHEPEDKSLSQTSSDTRQIPVTTSDKPAVAKPATEKPPTLSSKANATELEYDPNAEQNAALLNQFVVETQVCMGNSAKAALMTGDRNRESIVKFMTNACGHALSFFMTDTLGRPQKEVKAFLEALAYKELGALPGVSTAPTPRQ